MWWGIGNKFRKNFNRNSNIAVKGNSFGNFVREKATIPSRPHCADPWYMYQGSWGQHRAHLRPTWPRWAQCWPHELCFLGYSTCWCGGSVVGVCGGRMRFVWVGISHQSDVIMSAMASQITGIQIVCLTVCSGANHRKHQSSASAALWGEPTGDW